MAVGSRRGLCTLKLPQEAHFGLIFSSGFSELWARKFFDFFIFQGKNWINLVLSYRFELWNHFTRFFRRFEFTLDTVWLFFIFEFCWRPPHVLSVWAKVCLRGNRTWHHSASSKASWMIDTWWSEAEGVMYPQASTRSSFRSVSFQVGFRALSKGVLRFSSFFKVKTRLILYFLTVLSCGIIFQGF